MKQAEKIRNRAMWGVAWLLAATIWSCQAQSLEQAETERIIRELASDQMRGRKAGTPDAIRAAQFIADSFQKAGLQHFNGLGSYFQAFQTFQIGREQASLRLNEERIPDDDFFVLTDREAFSADKPGQVKVFILRAEDNFRAKFGEFRRTEEPYLVLVHPFHRESFQSFRRFFTRPGLTMERNPDRVGFWVLSDAPAVIDIRAEVRNKIESIELANVVGVLPGRSAEVVLFSAHYDHIGIVSAVAGDSIANGADDDASGVTAVIQLARYYSQQAQPPARTLVFAAFTAEEIGGFGSKYMAGKLNPETIVANVNIEMIGKPSKFGPGQAFITGFEKSDFGTVFQKAVTGKPYGFHPDPYPGQNLFYRSDNASFARMGVPAHTVSTVQIDQDKHYHQPSDEVETLDLAHMHNIIRAIAEGAATLVNGAATPTRIAPEGQ